MKAAKKEYSKEEVKQRKVMKSLQPKNPVLYLSNWINYLILYLSVDGRFSVMVWLGSKIFWFSSASSRLERLTEEKSDSLRL